MNEIAPLFQMVLVIAAVASPVILFARLMSGGEQGSLASLFAAPDPNAWPRGVQEEDPRPWGLGATAASAI